MPGLISTVLLPHPVGLSRRLSRIGMIGQGAQRLETSAGIIAKTNPRLCCWPDSAAVEPAARPYRGR